MQLSRASTLQYTKLSHTEIQERERERERERDRSKAFARFLRLHTHTHTHTHILIHLLLYSRRPQTHTITHAEQQSCAKITITKTMQ